MLADSGEIEPADPSTFTKTPGYSPYAGRNYPERVYFGDELNQTALGVQSPLGQIFFDDGGVSMAMGKKGVPTPNPGDFAPALVDKLLENGYSESDCKKFLGGNFYRVFKQVWR